MRQSKMEADFKTEGNERRKVFDELTNMATDWWKKVLVQIEGIVTKEVKDFVDWAHSKETQEHVAGENHVWFMAGTSKGKMIESFKKH